MDRLASLDAAFESAQVRLHDGRVTGDREEESNVDVDALGQALLDHSIEFSRRNEAVLEEIEPHALTEFAELLCGAHLIERSIERASRRETFQRHAPAERGNATRFSVPHAISQSCSHGERYPS